MINYAIARGSDIAALTATIQGGSTDVAHARSILNIGPNRFVRIGRTNTNELLIAAPIDIDPMPLTVVKLPWS